MKAAGVTDPRAGMKQAEAQRSEVQDSPGKFPACTVAEITLKAPHSKARCYRDERRRSAPSWICMYEPRTDRNV